MSLQGKLVLVTGGASGIGRAIAERCAAEGAQVLALSRSARESKIAVGSGSIEWMAADVTSTEDLERCATRCEQLPGSFHGIVCAAGILGELVPLADADLKDWWKVFEINVLGTAAAARMAVPFFRRSGGGRMVFFSGGGQGPQALRTAYTSSKGAIWRLTESLAEELRAENIFVNAVAPGAVNTKFLEDLIAAGPAKLGPKEYAQALEQRKSGGTPPTKAADLVSYLLSERSAGLTGKILSAVWDPYENFSDLADLSRSDIYTARRVIDGRGGTRFS